MKHWLYIFSFFLVSTTIKAQSDGQAVYHFLNLPFSSHNAALGGSNVALPVDGISGAMVNPALLSDATNKQIAINYTNYLYDVSMGNAAYGQNFGRHRLGAGLIFMDYGTFEGADEAGQSTGEFSAKDFALNLEYALQLDKYWTAGVTLKPIYSAYETYTAFGLGVDLGAAWVKPEQQMALGFVVANIGQQFSGYNNDKEKLPLNAIVSFTKKFEHAPLRIALTAHHLNKWDLSYTDTYTETSLTGEKTTPEVSNVDMFFRHIIFGVDLVPNKNFYLSASYNRQRAAELSLRDTKSMAGFSFGGGIKISKFGVGFAASQYQKGIWSYQFSLTTDLKEFKK